MKAWIWLRVLAVLLAFFAAGHTLGTAAPKVRHGSQEAALFTAMQNFRFPVMGFERTYWDFYRGFALVISILLLVMTSIAWQLSTISRNDPRQPLSMAITLLLGCVGLAVLSWIFFFVAPILISILAVACSALAITLMIRDSKPKEVL
jgi:hypothetical protein